MTYDLRLTTSQLAALEAILPAYLRGQRWFRAKAYTISSVQIVDAYSLPTRDEGRGTTDGMRDTSSVVPRPSSVRADLRSATYDLRLTILIAQVNYEQGDPHRYVLLLRFASTGDGADEDLGSTTYDLRLLVANLPDGIAAYDATADPALALGLLSAIRADRGRSGPISAWHTAALAALDPGDDAAPPTVMGVEQSNTSVRYGTSLILKLFRRLDDGISPELEIGRFLGEKGFKNTPPLAGAIEYVAGDAGDVSTTEPQTLAILQGFVPNQGDAWSYTLRAIEDYYTNLDPNTNLDTPRGAHLLDLALDRRPTNLKLSAAYDQSARLLGRRTAEMHAALASDPDTPAFAPEPFTAEYQDAMHRSMCALTEEAFRLLRGRMDGLPDETRAEAATLLSHQDNILARFEPLLTHRIDAMRTRCHGDYHLGQVLWTGDDFIIIDFEGEPVRPLSERRLKHSPLKDVAGMLRSFHYAAYSGMFDSISKRGPQERIELWADSWQLDVSAAYLRAYLDTAGGAPWLPASQVDLRLLLDAHLLEKAIYELLYEINMRPDWVQIPLKGILQLLA